MKKLITAAMITIMMTFTCFGMISATAQFRQKVSAQEISSTEETNQESQTGEGESSTEESSTEESSTEESTTEEPTTEEPTTEEPTTEEPTTQTPVTPDYEIIDGVYKVKDGILLEYLGNPKDKTITTLEIPASVEEIGNSVFEDCIYIKKVTFEGGSRLISIGQYAFKGCKAMTSITLPTGLEIIGYRAFGSCTALESLTIPATVTEGDMILGTVSGVKTVKFASGMTEIPSKILKGAASVTKVTLKSGITSIGSQAFYECSALTSINLPKGIKTIGKSAFYGCKALVDIKLPTTLKTLSDYAFKNCTSLKTLTLWTGITDIRTDVFAGDTNLVVKVYANSSGKAYARKNNIKWEFTDSELKRRAVNQAIADAFTKLISAKNAKKYQYKYLKNYVPQAVCVIGKYVVVSMYYPGLAKRSILVVYNKSTGKFVKKLILPSKDHIGSLANVKGRLVVGLNNISATDYIAVIEKAKLKKAKNNRVIRYSYKRKIAGYADFSTFDGTYYWAGRSANISSASMYGYKVKVKKKKLVFTKVHSYIVPANTQGMIALKGKNGKRTFVFTQSYGRLPSSKLIRYVTNLNSATLGKPKKTKMLPAMAEGLFRDSQGYLYVCFESAANLYCGNPDYTSEIQMKNIGKIKYKNFSKLKNE